MRDAEFKNWLVKKPLKETTANSRLRNCRTVEHYGALDLDDEFEKNCLADLIDRLGYSTEDAHQHRPLRHKVPIDGNWLTGSATLKSAVSLYKRFRESEVLATGTEQPSPQTQHKPNPTKETWPVWDTPSSAVVLEMAHAIVPFVRFLHPDIVRAVVADNQKHQTEWIKALDERNIDPAPYLWDGSPCAFPGVRRYAGSREIAVVRGHAAADGMKVEKALKLDDNDYPKQLWSFIFQGTQFSKFGPESYSLAHLADHKVHGNRYIDDFEVLDAEDRKEPKLHGLYTCPSNAVYIPRNFLKPTDFDGTIRSLLLRRAQELYGDFCNILPPFLKVRQDCPAEWHLRAFKWAEPVGSTKQIQAFLDFRKTRLKKLFETTAKKGLLGEVNGG